MEEKMKIYNNMTFVHQRDGRALFICEDGSEQSFNLPRGEFYLSAAGAAEDIEGMAPGRVYHLEITEGVLTEVVSEGDRNKRSGQKEIRRRYLTYKMRRGLLTHREFMEASTLGITDQRKDYSWLFIGVSPALTSLIFDFTVGITLFAGLCLTRMIWGEVAE